MKKPNRMVADGKTWKRVKAPKPWKPQEVGETLVGQFLGMKDKTGQHGPYQVALIKCPDGEVRSVSGTVAMTLFQAAAFELGSTPTIRLVWQGLRGELNGDHTYKDFDLYVADKAEPVVRSTRNVK